MWALFFKGYAAGKVLADPKGAVAVRVARQEELWGILVLIAGVPPFIPLLHRRSLSLVIYSSSVRN